MAGFCKFASRLKSKYETLLVKNYQSKRRLRNLPINGHNNLIESKGSMMMTVLTPDGPAFQMIIFRTAERVVDTAKDNKKPSYNGQNFVDPDRSSIVTIALGEWID
jgi:hypothetical protein